MLNDAFGGRAGISGVVLGDVDDESDSQAEEMSFKASRSKQKSTPVNELASAMMFGMSAIAASMKPDTDHSMLDALKDLQKTQKEGQAIQERQLALLEALVRKLT